MYTHLCTLLIKLIISENSVHTRNSPLPTFSFSYQFHIATVSHFKQVTFFFSSHNQSLLNTILVCDQNNVSRPIFVSQLIDGFPVSVKYVSIYQIMSVTADTHNVISTSDSIVRNYILFIIMTKSCCVTCCMKHNYSGTSLI